SVESPTANRQGGTDPGFKRMLLVRARAVNNSSTVSRELSMEEFRSIPVGSTTGRDFTQVVDSTPTASHSAAGVTMAGATGGETSYSLEGATLNNPSFGTVGTSIVHEFVESVEILEAGYDAEYGGGTGAQVHARRISGSNRVQGVARFAFTPRLADPRFINGTDNAIRTTEVPDFSMEGAVAASGPIVMDRLFWSAGVSVTRSRSSLVQSFHHRVAADGSGGDQGCATGSDPFDCDPRVNDITTRRFTDQRVRTGGVQLGYQLGLDWAITPRHALRLTALGSPGFNRRSYRGAAFDPFNPTLAADRFEGASVVSNGLVNDNLGWDRSDSLHTAAHYAGRLANDRIELDATVAYSRFVDETAWRLDDPSSRNTPATHYRSTEGINLLELLDDEGRTSTVAGASEACDSSSVPGQACPVRRWLSGGLGQYGTDRNHRAQARVNLTHFFQGAGSHQLKYGAAFEHLARRAVTAYSGHNDADFYRNCSEEGLAGQASDEGGEWCFDALRGQYVTDSGPRVDNHRYLTVDPDDPDRRTSYGFGRIRREQGQLGAIANAQGEGVRVPSYAQSISTQNYGMYLRDKWMLTSNLMINAGVRWEIQDMRNVLGERALLVWDNVGPRVGVAYDWTDEGRSRLFASYGWLYNPLPLQLISRVAGGQVDVRRTYRDSQCPAQPVTINGQQEALSINGQPTEYCADAAATTSQLVGGAVVPRLRGQYNQQIQAGYEQEVIEDLVLGFRWMRNDLRRGVEDVSTNGGTDFLIANPGVAVENDDIRDQRAQCDELGGQLDTLAMDDPARAPLARELDRCQFLTNAFEQVGSAFARPTRQFNAFTFDVRRRFSRNWMLLASYTYSRLRGNYDGFVDPVTGAINLGSNAHYDTPELVRNSFGPLSLDTPHRVKVDGLYIFDLGESGYLTMGTSFRFSSGLPISLRGTHDLYPNAPVYILPRGAGGRLQPNVGWNLRLSYAYPLPGSFLLEASIRILNVTNAKAALRVDQTYSFQRTRPVAGGDLSDLKHTKVSNTSNPAQFFGRAVVARQGNYGVATSFQTPLSTAFELRLRF
nr:TonB-dependent receptor [Deltaproteobacteria bacterium]